MGTAVYLDIGRRTIEIESTREQCAVPCGAVLYHSGTCIGLGTSDTQHLRQTCRIVVNLVLTCTLAYKSPQALVVTRLGTIGQQQVSATGIVGIHAYETAMSTLNGVELGVGTEIADIDSQAVYIYNCHSTFHRYCLHIGCLDDIIGLYGSTVLVFLTAISETGSRVFCTKYNNSIYLVLGDGLLNVVAVTCIGGIPVTYGYTGIHLARVL